MKHTLPQLDAFSEAAQSQIRLIFSSGYDSSYQKDALAIIQKHPEKVEEIFGKKLQFGTGGIRGLMGVGPNRLNEYTIEMTTQGLANYIRKKTKQPKPRVLICYDNRERSFFFAKLTARVLAGNTIQAYITQNLRPTPLCSFGCRYYNCIAAVMITASHNPPEYNGYKVYWKDGAQVVSPHDQGIIKEVNQIKTPGEVQIASIKSSLITWAGLPLDEAYFQELDALFRPYYPKTRRKTLSLKIIYSNLHGTGITLIPKALQQAGFQSVYYVKEQLATDPTFPGAKSPNPEEVSALEKGVLLLKKKEADVFFATDPDADRIGVVAMHQKKPVHFSGNQIACICLDFLIKNKDLLPKKAAFIKTIVTTELFRAICKAHHMPCYDVLTGFKYIAQKIAAWEKSKEHTFVFGAEESLGYLFGSFVRDKDSANAAVLIALAAEKAKQQKLSLYSQLKKIYASYGVYREKLFSLSFPPEKKEQMDDLMQSLRENPKASFGSFTTTQIEDYATSTTSNIATDLTTPLFLPKSNVLCYRFKNSSFILRPSGTEPKIKCYLSSERKTLESSVDQAVDDCDQELQELKCAIEKSLF